MTEVADSPIPTQDGEIARITHWIGGARVEGALRSTSPVFNPASGIETGAVDLASVEDVDAAVASALPGRRRPTS